jgi:hypothetical protein
MSKDSVWSPTSLLVPSYLSSIAHRGDVLGGILQDYTRAKMEST